jgi:hypothetical protein
VVSKWKARNKELAVANPLRIILLRELEIKLSDWHKATESEFNTALAAEALRACIGGNPGSGS